jgi:hypothetical protein
MSNEIRRKYSSQKIKNVYEHLIGLEKGGDPAEYQIKVDGTLTIRRRKDTSLFYLHEKSINEDTRLVEIMIFYGRGNHYDHYKFYMGEIPDDAVEMQKRINEELERQKQENDFRALEEENKELKEALEEQYKVMAEQAEVIRQLKQKPDSGMAEVIKAIAMSAAGAVNPQPEQLPGPAPVPTAGQGVNSEKANGPEISSNISVNDQDRSDLHFVAMLRSSFEADELQRVVSVLEKLRFDKARLPHIENLFSEAA